MNKFELKELLDLVSAVDSRTITSMTIEAWHPVVAGISLADAKEALVVARGDVSIGWVEPKHIVAKARDLRIKRATEQESEQRRNDPHVGYPCPLCVHNKPIVKCADCCRILSDSVNPDQTFRELTKKRL